MRGWRAGWVLFIDIGGVLLRPALALSRADEREMGLLRAGCCRFLHPAEGDATPVRFPLEHCFDAFGPEAGDHPVHEREVRTADEIVVLTRQGSEGAVAEDQAPILSSPRPEAALVENGCRHVQQPVAARSGASPITSFASHRHP